MQVCPTLKANSERALRRLAEQEFTYKGHYQLDPSPCRIRVNKIWIALMDVSEFVQVIRQQVEQPAVDGCLKNYRNPPGRRPSESLVQLSDWYKSLADEDKTMLERAMRDSVNEAIFGFFCVLDGVRVIENGEEQAELELWHVKQGVRTRINDPKLHDELNSA